MNRGFSVHDCAEMQLTLMLNLDKCSTTILEPKNISSKNICSISIPNIALQKCLWGKFEIIIDISV